MKFALLIYEDEAAWETKSTDERQAVFSEHGRLYERLLADGVFVAGEQFEPSSEATTLRAGGSRTPGPSRTGDEQLGGFYLIDVAGEAEALAYAASLSGTVEVRPIVVFAPEAG